MAVYKTIILILFLKLIFWTQCKATERWSRQTVNSGWVPLTNHRQSQRSQSQSIDNVLPSISQINRASSVSLSPPLQKQYKDQLLQLQRTQESIQKLLDLQEQLKAQQQLLQSHAYTPGDYKNSEQSKQINHQSMLIDLQAISPSASDVLISPQSGSESFSQTIFTQNVNLGNDRHKSRRQKTSKLPQDFKNENNVNTDQHFENSKDYQIRHNNFETFKRHKGANRVNSMTKSSSIQNEPENEEIQLVYIPAETLTQKIHEKNQKDRRPSPQHFRYNNRGIQLSPQTTNQKGFSDELLGQSQSIENSNNQFFQEERTKDIVPLNEEQKEFERQSNTYQKDVPRNEQFKRVRNQERRGQLEKQIDIEGRKELETQRKTIYQSEFNYPTELQREKDIHYQKDFDQQKELERRFEEGVNNSTFKYFPSSISESFIGHREIANSQAQPLVRNEQHHPYSSDVTKQVKNVRKHRVQPMNQRYNTYYEEDITTSPLSPNQPPLSIFMGTALTTQDNEVDAVLKLLKDAKSIAVIDSIGPNTPRVFVGPAYLDPPSGYIKFNLPYLSSIENNHTEKHVNEFPFFVASLNFVPPPGYFKIPFPDPHIGSIVVNTKDISTQSEKYQNHFTTGPLIEHNSYMVSRHQTPNYNVLTTPSYSQELGGSTMYKETQFYQDQNPFSDVTASVFGQEIPAKEKDYINKFSTASNYHESSYVTPVYTTNYPHSTSKYEQDLKSFSEAQIGKQKFDSYLDVVNHAQIDQNQRNQFNVETSSPSSIKAYDTSDDPENEQIVNPNQYNLPSKLPAISPQLPGLINSLMEKNEDMHLLTTPITTIRTSTTTTEIPVTSTRSRGRERTRVVPTRRTTTTLRPYLKSSLDKSKRLYNRPRSRLPTTTEEYVETSYESKKGNPKNVATRYIEQEFISPSSEKNPKFIGKDDEEKLSKIWENPKSDGVLSSNQQLETHLHSSINQMEDNLSAKTERYIYPKNINHQDQPSTNTDFIRHTVDLQDHNGNVSPTNSQTLKNFPVDELRYQTTGAPWLNDYSYYSPENIENKEYDNVKTTHLPEVQKQNEQEVLKYNSAFRSNTKLNTQNDNYKATGSLANKNYQSELTSNPQDFHFGPALQKEKHFNYDTQYTAGQSPELLTEVSITEPATVEVPSVIKQKVRGRLSGRVQQVVPGHSQESQDEYVQFIAVKEESKTVLPSIENRNKHNVSSRLKSRIRPQSKDSEIQLEGQDFVRIVSTSNNKKSVTSSTIPETGHVYNRHNDTKRILERNLTQKQDSKKRPVYVSSRRYPSVQSTTLRTITTTPKELKDTVSLKSRTEETKMKRTRGRIRRPSRRPTTTTSTEATIEDYIDIQVNDKHDIVEEIPQSSFGSNDEIFSNFKIRSNPNYENVKENYYHDYVLKSKDHLNPNSMQEDYEQIESSTPSHQKFNQNNHKKKTFSPQLLTFDINEAESRYFTKFNQNLNPKDAKDLIVNNTHSLAEDRNLNFTETIDEYSEIKDSNALKIFPDNDNISNPETTSSVDTKMKNTFPMVTIKENFNEPNSIVVTTTPVNNPIQQKLLRHDLDQNTSSEGLMKEEFSKTIRKPSNSSNFQKTEYHRRKVRIRVNPINEEFVTAESQHYGSPFNMLKGETVNSNIMPTVKFQDITSTILTTQNPSEKSHLNDSDKSSFKISKLYTFSPNDPQEQFSKNKQDITAKASESEDKNSKEFVNSKVDSSYLGITYKINDMQNNNYVSSNGELLNKNNIPKRKLNNSMNANITEITHPKNHRLEWSEIQSTNLSTYDFVKNESYKNESFPKKTKLVNKNSERETKIMSDYVQAIFDSIKNVSEKISTNSSSLQDEKYETAAVDKELNHNQYGDIVTISSLQANYIEKKVPNYNVKTTDNLFSESVIKPDGSNSELLIQNEKEKFKVTNSGGIFRTSTTTKVSHMTEICYRGKCVMAKPKVTEEVRK